MRLRSVEVRASSYCSGIISQRKPSAHSRLNPLKTRRPCRWDQTLSLGCRWDRVGHHHLSGHPITCEDAMKSGDVPVRVIRGRARPWKYPSGMDASGALSKVSRDARVPIWGWKHLHVEGLLKAGACRRASGSWDLTCTWLRTHGAGCLRSHGKVTLQPIGSLRRRYQLTKNLRLMSRGPNMWRLHIPDIRADVPGAPDVLARLMKAISLFC